MADDWYGMIVGDYEAVLPLPVKRKFGLKIIAMPPFVQQLALSQDTDPDTKYRMARSVLSFSRLIHINLSGSDFFKPSGSRTRTNYIIDLQGSYDLISGGYTAQCKKSIRQAERRGCHMDFNLSFNDVLAVYQNAYGNKSSYGTLHYDKFRSLVEIALEKGMCHLGAVCDESGELVYAGLLLDDGRRLYYLMGAPTEKGRQMRATYFFINSVIRKFADSGKLFDFEGSDIPDVAKFYQSFSPRTEYYSEYYINQYPFPFNKMIDRKLKPF